MEPIRNPRWEQKRTEGYVIVSTLVTAGKSTFRFRSSETPETCQETSPEQTNSNQSNTANILELSFSILQLIMFLEL
jgi:hypothetical protein